MLCMNLLVQAVTLVTLARYFKARIHEYLFGDKSSHVFKHFNVSTKCREASSIECFNILDTAQSEYQMKLKEAMHIKWLHPVFNQLVMHAL